MTAVPMNEAVTVSEPTPQRSIARFLGKESAYWRLFIRGSFLLLVTLGIYRFWLATDQRRFLWGNTEVAGQSFEYNGTALELLLGFLIAIAIIVPLNVIVVLLALALGVGEHAALPIFLVLAVFGQYAIYRARRYRLTRTVYRGVRFHQTGSAWRYAAYSTLWWILIVLTVGLAYPWAQASLERYKMRHTFYGDLRGSFVGSGSQLFIRGIGLWAIVVAPFLLGLVATIAAIAIDWPALRDALAQGSTDFSSRVDSNPALVAAVVFTMFGLGWPFLAGALLYPAFQALMLRWWTSGLRFGELKMASHLRTGPVYRAYLRFLGYALLLVVAISLASLVIVFATRLAGVAADSTSDQVLQALALLATYVLIALGFSVIYQVTVKLRLWWLTVATLDLSGLAVLERVTAAGQPSSSFGEGLADALNVGGL
jgi:uncharacterized membrane protein YjgN (DUF898 family)